MLTTIYILIAVASLLALIGIFNFFTPAYKSLEHKNKNFIVSAFEGLRDFVKIFLP